MPVKKKPTLSTLSFPTSERRPALKLDVVTPCSDSAFSLPWNVFLSERIRQGYYNEVWAGTYGGVRFVAKITAPPIVEANERMLHEADVYATKLGKLQGTIVPRFYGCYIMKSANVTPTMVILLEHCGSPHEKDLSDLTTNAKLRIFSHYRALHLAGVEQRDLSHDNIVFQNHKSKGCRDLRIIDFEDAATNHTCVQNLDPPSPDVIRPMRLGCPELGDLEHEELDIFLSAMVSFRGEYVRRGHEKEDYKAYVKARGESSDESDD